MYKLSQLAAEDFAAIYEYTLLNFGVIQADAYTQDLEKVLTLLSEHPFIGIASDEIGKDIRRHDHQRHTIFFRMITRFLSFAYCTSKWQPHSICLNSHNRILDTALRYLPRSKIRLIHIP